MPPITRTESIEDRQDGSLAKGGIIRGKRSSLLVGERGCVFVTPLSPLGVETLAKAIAEAQRRQQTN